MDTNLELFRYIESCPTAYHACGHTGEVLVSEGYEPLSEGEPWALIPGGKYFVRRNGSSLIAFRIPADGYLGFMLTASHGDSPCFKLRETPEMRDDKYTRLSAEKYGGMLCAPWMDRPLSAAGRVTLRRENGIAVRLADLREPVAVIPSVAIHMNRGANENAAYNAAVDMVPLMGCPGEVSIREKLARTLDEKPENILSTDLFLYNPQSGVVMGDTISAPRLDDLQCAFGTLQGFLQAGEGKALPVYCLFDNEEVGSETKQGAASTFLRDTLERIAAAFGKDLRELLPHSMMLSCDNAHAIHPNHPEYADKTDAPRINGGVVVKYNANQKYTTDGVSAALFTLLCERAGVPTQRYSNRPDLPGGSTLGSIANTKVALPTVDIGLPQLAMHSAFETAGALDTDHLIRAARCFFESAVAPVEDGFTLL